MSASTLHTNPSAEPKKDRDARGRFARGNRGGPGNPFNRQVANLRKALLDVVGAGELAEVIRVLIGQALGGHTESAKVLLTTVIGQAGKAPDPDALDLNEWRQHVTDPATAQALEHLLGCMPHGVALSILQLSWPVLVEQGKAESFGAPPAGGQAVPSTNGPVEGAPPPAAPSTNGVAPEEAAAAPSTNGTAEAATGAKEMKPYPAANPYARKAAALRAAAINAVSEDDFRGIGQALLRRSLEGHLPSARLLLRYLLGKPARATNPDTLDLAEWQLLRSCPVTAEDFQTARDAFSHQEACALLAVRPHDVPQQVLDALLKEQPDVGG